MVFSSSFLLHCWKYLNLLLVLASSLAPIAIFCSDRTDEMSLTCFLSGSPHPLFSLAGFSAVTRIPPPFRLNGGSEWKLNLLTSLGELVSNTARFKNISL